MKASRSSIDSLRLGGLDIRLKHLMAANLSQLEVVLGRLSPNPIHGIIGQDVMREHRAVIDVEGPMPYLREADSTLGPVPANRCAQPVTEAQAD